MDNAIITGIQTLKDELAEMQIDLEVAQENAARYKIKAARVPKLEAELKILRAENLSLLTAREKILKTL